MDIFTIKTSVENSGYEKLYYNYYFILDKNHEHYKFNVKCTSLKDVSLVRL